MKRRLFPPLMIPLEDLGCVVLIAFFAMQGSIPGIAPAQDFHMTGLAPTALTTIGGIVSQAVVYSFILILLLRRPSVWIHGIRALPWAGLLALLAIASAAWSIDPFLTLRRAIPFALAGLYGLYLAGRYSVRYQLQLLRTSMLLLAVGTIALVMLAPSIGLDHSPGHQTDWQGLFTQKNACGRIMVLGSALILFAEPLSLHRIPVRRAASLALFLFILVMSGSRGAWLIELALLALWIALHLTRCTGTRLRLVSAIAAPFIFTSLFVAAAHFLPHIARLLGRDPSLTGRTAIWAQVLRFIAQRPLAGYGYDAFWRGMQGPSFQVDAAVHFVVEHAHNGFLEILLGLGTLGLLVFLLSWSQAARRLWPLWRTGEVGPIAFPIAILVLMVLYNLDENTLLIHNGLFWILYVEALARIEYAARDLRHIDASPTHVMLTPKGELYHPPHPTALSPR